MAEFQTVISETGLVPHSACRCSLRDLGEMVRLCADQKAFAARPRRSFGHTEAQNGFINHFISFDFPDTLLRRAIDRVCAKYANAVYVVGVQSTA